MAGQARLVHLEMASKTVCACACLFLKHTVVMQHWNSTFCRKMNI